MRHLERETFEYQNDKPIPWYCSDEKAFTKIITTNERNRITRWLTANGAKQKLAQDISNKPKNIDIWTISEEEPLFIHYNSDLKSGKRIIRLDASSITAAEMIEDRVLSKPIPPKA